MLGNGLLERLEEGGVCVAVSLGTDVFGHFEDVFPGPSLGWKLLGRCLDEIGCAPDSLLSRV